MSRIARVSSSLLFLPFSFLGQAGLSLIHSVTLFCETG